MFETKRVFSSFAVKRPTDPSGNIVAVLEEA